MRRNSKKENAHCESGYNPKPPVERERAMVVVERSSYLINIGSLAYVNLLPGTDRVHWVGEDIRHEASKGTRSERNGMVFFHRWWEPFRTDSHSVERRPVLHRFIYP